MWIFNIIFNLQPKFFKVANAYCETNACPFYISSDISKKIIPPPVCSGASHQAIHKHDLAKVDVEYRRMMRMVAGPLADTNGASPHKGFDNWIVEAAVYDHWMLMRRDFVFFSLRDR